MPTQQWTLTPWWNAVNRRVMVEIDPAEIVGRRTLFTPTLLLQFKCIPDLASDAPVRLLSLEGWIAWNSEQVVLGGIRIPSQALVPNNTRLVVPISDEQIETIEANRTDEATVLRVSLSGTASMPNPREQPPQRDGRSVPLANLPVEVHAVRSSSGDGGENLYIGREQWLKILEGLGAGKRRLIELPQPTLPIGQDQWTECLRLLTEATQHYRKHEFESVLSNCRKIVEGVTEILCSRFGIAREPNKPFTVWSKDLPTNLASVWPIDREDSTMFYALLNAAWKWTSSSHHYGSGIPYRDDVSFALSLATDLMMFSAKVLVA